MRNNKTFLFLLLTIFISASCVFGIVEDDPNDIQYFSYDDKDLTGTTVEDLTNNQNSTNVGATTGQTGIFNEAFDFDGTNDYISNNGLVNEISNDNIGSVNAWFKTTQSSYAYWFTTSQYATGGHLALILTDTGAPRFDWSGGCSGSTSRLTGNTSMNDGAWHMVTWNSDGATNRLYLDGTLQTLTVNTGSNTGNWFGDNPSCTPDRLTVGALLRISNPSGELFYDGLMDELSVWNKTLDQSEVTELFNLGAPTSEQQYPFSSGDVSVNDSVESTAVVKQIGSVSFTGGSPTNIFSSQFNISVNNTDLYGSYSFNVLGSGSNVLFCELNIDGQIVGNVTRTQTVGELGSVYLQSNIFTLNEGTHNQSLTCERQSGGGQITISNAVGVGHILIDEFNNVVPNEELNASGSVSSGSSYTLLDEINFTISNRTIGGDRDVQHMLVLEWAGSYTNNAGSAELLDTYISINNTNCSFYPRTVNSGGVGSVSGDCLIKNASNNGLYNIKVYGNGSNSNYLINVKIKEFLLSPEEIEGGTGFPVPTVFSGDTNVLLFNFSGGNLNHGISNVFQKNAFSIRANETTTAIFFVQLVNGTNFTTVNFTREINGDVGVLIGQDVLENIPQDNYISKLWANCGGVSAECTIVGGDGIGYITDVTTTILNAFNISVFDNFDNTSVSNFSVVNGVTFNTSLGNLLYFTNDDLVNFTVMSSFNGGYFSVDVVNHNTSNDLNISMNQTVISWDCLEEISGNNLNCSNPLETVFFNYNTLGNPHSQVVNVTGYFGNVEVFNVTPLLIEVKTSELAYLQVTFNSSSPLGTVNNCVYNITSNAYSWNNSLTGDPNGTINLINDTYTVIVDCVGFAVITENVSLTGSYLSVLSNTFVLYTENSIQLNFYDVLTQELMNGTNITVQFIGTTAQTVITENGSVYVDLLSPDEYTIIYSADGYRQGSYIFTLTDRTYNPFTLYMQPVNDTELLLMTVKDTYGNYVEKASITIQRYLNNSWITEQIRDTDFQGRTEAYFVLSTEFYNFLVSVDGVTYFGVINSDSKKKQIYAEDVSNGIEIVINRVNDTVIRSYQSLYGVVASLTFVNTSNVTGYFRFSWDDSSNEAHTGGLTVYRDGVLNCSSSGVSEAGIVYCYVTENGTALYTAVSSLDGEEVKTLGKRYTFNSDLFIDWGAFGFAFLFIILVLVFFIYLESPTFSLYIGSGLFSLGIVFGLFFSDVSLTVVSLILALTSLVAGISSKSGGNG